MKKARCPICQSKQSKLLFKIKAFKYNLCFNCQTIYLVNHLLGKKQLQKLYRVEPDNRWLKLLLERFMTWKNNQYRKSLIYRFKKQGRILDVGCGSGSFIASFRPRYWETFAVDPYSTLNRSQKNKVKFFNQSLLECGFPDKYFDIISAWHVLEHLTSPLKVLKEIRRVLKDDGFFIFSTPNSSSLGFKLGQANWFHLAAPAHRYIFNRQSLDFVCKKAGFKTLKWHFPLWEYPLALPRTFLALKYGWLFFIPVFLLEPILSIIETGETILGTCIKDEI